MKEHATHLSAEQGDAVTIKCLCCREVEERMQQQLEAAQSKAAAEVGLVAREG